MRRRTGTHRRGVAIACLLGASIPLGPALPFALRAGPPAIAAAAPVSAPVSALIATIDLSRPLNSFRPDRTLGAGVDGQGQGDIGAIYTPANLRAMMSAGLAPLTYRLRTELGVEAWHWNPRGHWSDPAHHRGYWTSSTSGPAVSISNGYRLPRRGDTIDQANDDGYSRLDDGDPRSFWKSNPYLDAHFTHEPQSAHPQWVLVDLYGYRGVDALRIDWGAPYATDFRVQRFQGPSAIALAGHPPGRWIDFPLAVHRGRGGSETVRVARRPVTVRFLRVLLLRGSHTAPRGSRDIRDRLGYAIRELHVGTLTRHGLHDLVRHRRDGHQTITMASSTDPWHRSSDRDPNTEQPGFDRVAASGLTRGLPLLTPVPVLYGTPVDAAAEIRYLERRHIRVSQAELGEEPDGQLAAPEDYAALYLQYARAIHRVDPRLVLGGPSLQTSIPDWYAWPDARGQRSWTARFVAALHGAGALSELGFFSFEWYPFDNVCGQTAPQLAHHAATFSAVIRRQRQHGVPAGVPLVLSEYGYSAFAGTPEVELVGGLLNADIVGRFLTEGGATAYLYGYEPNELIQELRCSSWGNLALLQSDSARHILHPLATYWVARMLTQDWTVPGDGLHTLYGARVNPDAQAGAPRISAYPVLRSDGRLAVLLLNKDPSRTASVSLRVLSGRQPAPGIGETLDVSSLSSSRYVWHARADRGYPRPDLPPAASVQPASEPVVVPPYSVVVAVAR